MYSVISFPNTESERRTDDSFRKREQEEHHKNMSIIEKIIGVDMIADFPTSDPLHLLHLGVMKRCLLRWVDGTKSYKTKLRTRDLNQINVTLLRLKSEMPTEIHRAVRDFSTLHFWKGTEYRTFLLYLGIVALKDSISADEYDHFIYLSCAAILCSSDVYIRRKNNVILVDTLLSDYVQDYIDLYGEHTISSNVHNLIHLHDDLVRFGDLDSISTYPFENALRMMKLKLRSMANPLQQLSRRMTEIFLVIEHTIDQPSRNAIELKHPINKDRSKFQAVIFNGFRLSSMKFGDKWFMDKKKRIIEFKYANRINGLIFLHGYEIKDKRNFFTAPLFSSELNIYSTNNDHSEECLDLITSKIEDIKCKMVCTSYNSEFIFQPLLHTLK